MRVQIDGQQGMDLCKQCSDFNVIYEPTSIVVLVANIGQGARSIKVALLDDGGDTKIVPLPGKRRGTKKESVTTERLQIRKEIKGILCLQEKNTTTGNKSPCCPCVGLTQCPWTQCRCATDLTQSECFKQI